MASAKIPPTRYGSNKAPPAPGRPAPATSAAVAQPWYRINNRARFTTEQGSTYTISHRQVRRDKFDNTAHINAKNIFYIKHDEGDQVLDDYRQMAAPHVEKIMNKYYFVYDTPTAHKSFRIHREPKLGYCPIDFFLAQDGSIDLARARLHVGHAITNIEYS